MDDVPPIDGAGTAIGATLLTMVVTPLLSLLVLGLFRRSLARSMRTVAPGHAPLPVVVPARAPADRSGSAVRPLTAFAADQVRSAAIGYLVAGVAYAVTAACVLLTVNGQELGAGRIAMVALVFAWPLVPTLAVVVAPGRLRTAAAVVAYAVALVLLAAVLGLGVTGLLSIWITFVLPAVLVLATVAAPRLRAVGPFLAPSAFVLGAGLMIWFWLALPFVSWGASAGAAILLALGVVLLAAVLAFLNVPVAARRYRRKTAGDQSIAIDQWWLLASLFPCLVVSSSRGWPGLAMLLVPYGVYRVVVHVSRGRCGRRAADHRPTRLLLLRVFGSRSRSERLMRDLGAYWRYAGSIDLIAGSDLAAENLEPHEFLEFVRGRMARRFVVDRQDLDRRIAERDIRPDRDGRFRVNEFFCHDDTWRATLHRLLEVTDVIVIDLRELTPGRQGVGYELRRLVELGLLARVVALVDDSTDSAFLHGTLQAAGAGHGPGLCTVRAASAGRATTLDVLDRLEAAGRSAGDGTVTLS
jgi:hypothetical protein